MMRRTVYLAGVASDARGAEARAAFASLVRLWHPVWLRFSRAKCGDLADDAVQEAVVTMARNIHRLRAPDTFRSWSMTIVHRRSVDLVRRAVRRRKAEGGVQTPEPDQPADISLDLRAALATLRPEDRRLIRLHYACGHTMSELSKRLGVPAGTIKSRLFAARQALKTHLEGNENDQS